MKKIKVELDLTKLQNLRFAQALLEISNNFYFGEQYNNIFEYLNVIFDTDFHQNISIDDEFKKIKINSVHSEPSISIQDKKYILVFPGKMIQMLKANWIKNKTKTTFNGLLTEKRYLFIRDILKGKKNFFKKILFTIKYGILIKLPKRILNGKAYKSKFTFDSFHLVFTNQGRKFPEKAWDQDYYETLLNSKYVLCPDGDYIWTYRFFESVLCGAIPVIQNTCDAYEGFNYLTVEQYRNDETLSEQQIESNFLIISEKFSLDKKDILELLV